MAKKPDYNSDLSIQFSDLFDINLKPIQELNSKNYSTNSKITDEINNKMKKLYKFHNELRIEGTTIYDKNLFLEASAFHMNHKIDDVMLDIKKIKYPKVKNEKNPTVEKILSTFIDLEFFLSGARKSKDYLITSLRRRLGIKKTRKDTDEGINNAIESVMANILSSFFTFGYSGYFWIQKGKGVYTKSRYNKHLSSRAVNTVLELLEKKDFVVKQPHIVFQNPVGRWERFTARYRANIKLLTLLATMQLGVRNIIYTGETIIIKKKKTPTSKEETKSNYKDTDDTIKMRKDVERYNKLLRNNYLYIEEKSILNNLDLGFDNSELTHDELVQGYGKDYKKNPDVDLRPLNFKNKFHMQFHSNYVFNYYYRVFNRGSTNYGGRYYGHWLLNTPSEMRKHLILNGNKTVELDYSNMNMHIAYSLEGIDEFSEQDLYNLYNTQTEEPSNISEFPDYFIKAQDDVHEEDRNMHKQFITIAFNSSSSSKAISSTIKELELPKNYFSNYFKDVISLLKKNHSLLVSKYFFKGKDMGVRLMRHESNIATNIINTFVKRNIPIYCIHDGFITEAKHEKLLRATMESCFYNYFHNKIHGRGGRTKASMPLIK